VLTRVAVRIEKAETRAVLKIGVHEVE